MCACGYGYACHSMWWKPEDNLRAVGPRDQTENKLELNFLSCARLPREEPLTMISSKQLRL